MTTLLIIPIRANAVDIECAIGKYKSYATAQEQWQRALTDLTIRTNGTLKEVANLYLTNQLNHIEMNRIAVEFMLHRSPKKVHLEAPVNQWLDLDRDDKSTISKNNNRYSELLRFVNSEKHRPDHPDGDAIRRLMRERIVKMIEYQNLLTKFNTAVAKINGNVCGG